MKENYTGPDAKTRAEVITHLSFEIGRLENMLYRARAKKHVSKKVLLETLKARRKKLKEYMDMGVKQV